MSLCGDLRLLDGRLIRGVGLLFWQQGEHGPMLLGKVQAQVIYALEGELAACLVSRAAPQWWIGRLHD